MRMNAARAICQLMEDGMKDYQEFQKAGQENFDTAIKNFGEVNMGIQAITSEVTDYSKKAFAEGTAAFEQLMGVKSVEQAIEIQTGFAKKAYDDYVSQASKLGEMYVSLTKEAYKPIETAFAKKA